MTRVLACHKCDQGVFNECMMVLRIGYFCRQCSEKAVPISVNLSYLCRLFQFRLYLTPYSAWHALTHYLQSFTVVLPRSRCSWLEREFPRPYRSRPNPPKNTPGPHSILMVAPLETRPVGPILIMVAPLETRPISKPS